MPTKGNTVCPDGRRMSWVEEPGGSDGARSCLQLVFALLIDRYSPRRESNATRKY